MTEDLFPKLLFGQQIRFSSNLRISECSKCLSG
jgi:hypothetical protein